jgi:hypothetical protein
MRFDESVLEGYNGAGKRGTGFSKGVLSDKWVTTRKAHECAQCGMECHAGDTMRAISSAVNGSSPETSYTCLECDGGAAPRRIALGYA